MRDISSSTIAPEFLWETIDDLYGSDHLPILISMNLNASPSSYTSKPSFNLKKPNESLFLISHPILVPSHLQQEHGPTSDAFAAFTPQSTYTALTTLLSPPPEHPKVKSLTLLDLPGPKKPTTVTFLQLFALINSA